MDEPSDKKYSENVHAFVPPEANKETNPLAERVLSPAPLVDTKLDNCPPQSPYYDGVACIQCGEPFILFDVTTKKCVVCEGK